MRRPDDEPLALERLEAYEPPELPGEADGPRHAQPTDTDELRSELASLEARLASYPTPLAEQLDQARALRTSAEADLELADGRLAEFARENEGSRWWRRRPARRGDGAPAARAGRARHRKPPPSSSASSRPRCRIRRQWEAEHAPVRERAAELRTELAARREHHVERSAIPP